MKETTVKIPANLFRILFNVNSPAITKGHVNPERGVNPYYVMQISDGIETFLILPKNEKGNK